MLEPGHKAYPHNAVQGQVAGRLYMGSFTAYELQLPNQRRMRVDVSNADRHADPFEIGTAVTAHWMGTAPVVIVD